MIFEKIDQPHEQAVGGCLVARANEVAGRVNDDCKWIEATNVLVYQGKVGLKPEGSRPRRDERRST